MAYTEALHIGATAERTTMGAIEAEDDRRALQAWFATPLGQLVADAERSAVRDLLGRRDGIHLLQVGGYGDGIELQLPSAVRHWAVDSVPSPGLTLRGWPDDLPLRDDSVNTVVLVHALEFAEVPHSILREAVRVLAPEGRLLIIGFNPASLWGLTRAAAGPWKNRAPWDGHYYGGRRLRDWCSLLDLEPLQGRTLFFRPPVQRPRLLQRMEGLERLAGRWLPWFGGVNILASRKRVARIIPLGGVPFRPRVLVPGRLTGGGAVTGFGAANKVQPTTSTGYETNEDCANIQ